MMGENKLQTKELKKVNVVFSGGGMKGGYTAGFLRSFVNEYHEKDIEFSFYCVSASVATTVYFLSYELDAPDQKIWVDGFSPEINKVKNSKFHIDVDGVMDLFKDFPISKENILKSKHRIVFSLYNITKSRVEYFTNRVTKGMNYIGDYDIYELVYAAISAPVYYDKFVRIGKYEYCDPTIMGNFIIPENKNKTIFVLQNCNIAQSRLQSFFFIIKALFGKHKRLNIKFAMNSFSQWELYKKVKVLVKKKEAIRIEQIHKLAGDSHSDLNKAELNRNLNIGKKTYLKFKNKIDNFLSNA